SLEWKSFLLNPQKIYVIPKTFEEMAELSKKHALEMIEKSDEAHSKAMREMQELMHFPQGMNAWYENKRKAFECCPSTN
ncbi:hypothetical protein, partial [Flavobacterium frigidarium]|uniref:hypothetical protein n=1 Tax=Flavobacterium frigidarium TaxID=99286 RepID=UPI0030D8B995